MKRKRVGLIKSGLRTIELCVTGFDPVKARRHHKKHGDMHGKLCLLSECPIHYPKPAKPQEYR